MTIHTIDNSADDLKKVVLWQYDKAYRLLTVLHMMKTYYEAAVASFWSNWANDVLNIDTCTDFGATLWGFLLGVKRPEIGEPGIGGLSYRTINLATYRKLLKAAFFFLKSTSSMTDLVGYRFGDKECQQGYLQILFTPMTASDIAQLFKVGNAYSEGDIVKLDDAYYYCATTCSAEDNTSWDAVKEKFKSYCGVTLIDNLDMSLTYEKTEFFDNMDYDQQALYDQLGESFLLYPLGIRYNNKMGNAYFGLVDQKSVVNWKFYAPFQRIVSGSYVLVDEEGGSNQYECFETIDADQNTDIETAKQWMVKLDDSKIATYRPAIEIKEDIIYRYGEDGELYHPTKTFTEEENAGWDAVSDEMALLQWTGGKLIVTGSGAIENAPAYEPNRPYEKGDVVLYGEVVYYCTSNISQAANDEWNSIVDRFTPCWRDIIFSATPTPIS